MTGNCKNIRGKLVCGMLHAGGKATKDGLYRLAKGEKVFSPNQLQSMCKGGKCKTKKKTSGAGKGKRKKCNCKH